MQAPAPPLTVLFEDAYLLAIHKPSGLLCQATGAPADLSPNAEALLSAQVGQEVWCAHRLDRATSGLLLLVRDRSYLAPVQQLFADRSIHKKYQAMVVGELPDTVGIIETPLPVPHRPGVEQEAKTEYRVVSDLYYTAEGHRPSQLHIHQVEVTLHTGRKHQIRRHFGGIDCPILGDTHYGREAYNRIVRRVWNVNHLWLHSHQVGFVHPFTQAPISITCPFPGNWQHLLPDW